MAVNLCAKNDRGRCSRLIKYYNLRRKRACKSKPVQKIILKKDNNGITTDFGSSGNCRKRKSVSPPREDDVTLRFVLKRRKLDSPNHAVLQDSELESRVFAFESASGASGYSEEKQGIEESLARICKSEEALRGCGRLDNYERLDGISCGGFGAVYRARDRRTGEIVAMKDQFDGMSVPTLREIDILRSLGRHRGIVGFKEVVVDDSDGVYIIMEYAEYDLHRYLEGAEGCLTPADVKELMLQLLEGVKFLHDNRVMHRDIKPCNILIDARGVLKICDFGLSRWIDAAAGLYGPHVGTGCYKAPELLRGEKAYSEAVDMWAVGCVMAEMLMWCAGGWEAGRLEAICRIVGDAEGGGGGYQRLRREFFPAVLVSEAGFDLLKMLLCCDPIKRITAEDALNHLWFQE